MKKIILILILFFISFSFTYSANEQNNEPGKNFINIRQTLKTFQSQNNYIDYDYPDVSFGGKNTTGNLNINLYVKDTKGNIINYNGIINIEPLYFGDSFSFGEIPKSINIANGKGNIIISATTLKDSVGEKDGLGLILTTQNKDLVGNILTFANVINSININDYLDKITIKDTKEIEKSNTKNTGNDSEYTLYNPEKPNTYGYKSIKLNENGELVYEYDKKYYEELLKVYGGQGILFFDKNSNYKVSLNSKIEEKNDSIYITFLKENLKSIYQYCKKTIEFNWVEGDLVSGVEGNVVSYFTHCYNLLNSDLGLYSIYNSDSNNAEQFMNIKIEILKSLYNYKKLGEIYQNAQKNAINTGWYSENDFNSFNDNIIKFKFYEIPEDSGMGLVRNLNYLKDKYNNFYKLNENSGGFFTFDIEKDKEILNKFITDSLYYSIIGWDITNIGNLYLNKNNELYYIGEKRAYTDHNYFTINYDNLHLSCSNRDNICTIFSNVRGSKNGNFPVSFKDFINVNSNTIYFNISKLLQLAQKNNFVKNIDLSKLTSIDINLDKFDFPYIEDNDILSITSKIKSPKDVSANPFLVGVNILLALLYLFTFYFTAQLFNSYFEELSNKKNWNEKISNFFSKLLILPILQFGRFLNFLYKKMKFNFGIKINNKIGEFLKKYEHKIFVILCLILLGIIGQIVVDDFDIFSLEGWYVIGIMIFVLAFITLFKDMLLYILNKKTEKDNLKIEVIPVGYIVAFIVAIFGRTISMIPGVMFGSVIKVEAKSDATSEKLAKPSLLFKILMTSFTIGIISWLLTLLFDSNTFVYKFLMVTYFGLVNDVFFALLPFGMLWGVYILKDKTIKLKWFIFTFIVFLFLLHTIINPEGDLNKILNFDGNFLILIAILFFWILITSISYFYINKKIISK